MKNGRMVALMLSISLAAVGLAGCGNIKLGAGKTSDTAASSQETDSKTSDEEKADKDQYLNVAITGEPKTLDVSKVTDANSARVIENTQESLTRKGHDKDGNMELLPGLAEEWEVSDDGLTWTFHLRDAKWSDGQAVTADQFVYSLMRTLNPDTASSYASLLFPIKGAEDYNSGKGKAEDVGVKAVDDKTLEITLASPCAYFSQLTYFPTLEPQREDIIEKIGETYGSEADGMVYCGPFKVDSWSHNSNVQLVKNDSYWDADSVKLDKVNIKIISEKNTVMQELYTGSLDVADVSMPEWIEKFKASGNFEYYKEYAGRTDFFYFNTTKELNGELNVFSNTKVRQAFSIALDRDGLVQTVNKGLGEVANSFVPPKVQVGDQEYRGVVTDEFVKKLGEENPDPKALLVEGLKELGLGDDPSEITVTCTYGGTDETTKEAAEYMQNNIESKLGISMEIQYIEWAQYLAQTNAGNFQMANAGWSGDYNDPNTFLGNWASSARMFTSNWKNDDFDECISAAASSNDETERTNQFKRAEEILIHDDAVCVPYIYKYKSTFAANYVKNYQMYVFGSPAYRDLYTYGRK